MDRQLTWLRVAALAGSVAVHVGAYAALGVSAQASALVRGPSAVDFQVVGEKRVKEVNDVPEVKEEVPAQPVRAPAKAMPRAAEEVEVKEDSKQAPVPGEPVDLTGVTLTNDGTGAGWTSMVGDGSRMQGPLRRPSGRKQEKTRAETPAKNTKPAIRRAAPKKKQPELVPVADLSRRPRPPALAGVLRRHYPPEARRRGLEGVAVVTARVESDGRVRSAQIASESAAGFGAACRATLVGSVWTPPLDQSGRPVATRIRYTCRFQVSR